MPDPESLNALRDALQRNFVIRPMTWGNPGTMTVALKSVVEAFSGAQTAAPSKDLLQAALQRFAGSRQIASFTELKYVCYGATLPVGSDQWRLIDRQPLFDSMLALVDRHASQPRLFRRCFQGLLSGYFGFERNLNKPSAADRRWVGLRQWLADQLDPMLAAALERAQAPDWLNTLADHRNLLTADPCSRYAAALARDDTAELHGVCKGLGISGNSWVWHDALMAYVQLACAQADSDFKPRVPAILQLVKGRTDVTLSPVLAVKTTARVVARYAQCADHPEHGELRDTCVEWIGNPWIKRPAWDAVVNFEPARLMVDSWLKGRLIRDFFEILAADGAADVRRLHYWLRWVPQISDMWLMLGRNAYHSRSPALVELRKRAGRDRQLVDPIPANNAFVMRIGPLLVIEFGSVGNACFVHVAEDFKPDLERPAFRSSEFRLESRAARLLHQGQWEPKFDSCLQKLLRSLPTKRDGVKPARGVTIGASQSILSTHSPSSADWSETLAATTPTPVQAHRARSEVDNKPWSDPLRRSALAPEDTTFVTTLCQQHNLEWEDNRPKNGAFWVLMPDRSQHLAVGRLLERRGFQLKAGVGYWIKGE